MTPRGVILCMLVLGCGKSDEHTGGSADTPAGSAATGRVRAASAFKGKYQLVNLLVDGDGKSSAVDVWLRKSEKFDAVKLAGNVEFGAVSASFGVPSEWEPVILPAGSEPDAKMLAKLQLSGHPRDSTTAILTSINGKPQVNYTPGHDTADGIYAPNSKKVGLVVLDSSQFGSPDFVVGDGAGGCRASRPPNLNSSAPKTFGGGGYYLELDPGKQTISLHPAAGNNDDCSKPVFTFEVDVTAGSDQWVFIYSRDGGKTLATLAVPFI